MALRANKVANIILSLSEMNNLSIQDATDIYYKSATSSLIEDGVADLQCRSDKYLASLVWDEFKGNDSK
ncbi:MAG: DUF3791 domain-containing protein [Muribaculaceae bacterium]|nr:DUF3791 domain-containing protein [Muribaculaceae bacterium]